jgi:asparagine synthase (glutamine-hydrolysing)
MPYRAPISETLAGPDAPRWTRDAFDPDAIAAAGVFDPAKVRRLREKLAQPGRPSGESDEMALMAVASVQLIHSQLLAPSQPSIAAQAAVEVAGPYELAGLPS